jgi:hypothetical protein
MLSHGQRITKRELEVATSYWSPEEFVSLCNAVAWASARRQDAILPSFTERVYVKDKGIDAEYITLDTGAGDFSPFIGAGWNVLQYKQRDIQAQNRAKIFSDLKNELKKFTGKELEDGKKEYYGALRDVYERTGERPRRYVLFTNIDLTQQQNKDLKAVILEGYDQPETVKVVVNGAANLAALLNDLPHLRSAYFVPSRFCSWEQAWKSHVEEKLLGSSIELIGRRPQLTTLGSYLHDSNLRAVILTGPTGIGKSRLALEATKSYQTETIIALDPASMTASDLLSIESPGAETIVIIENPDPKKAEEFVRHALSRHELKLVITLPSSEHVLAPNFRRDKRVKLFPLDILTDQHARELLKVAGARFDFGIESWIIAQADGNPGILLVAASIPDLRRSTNSFIDDVATTFEYKIRQELGNRAVEVLRQISLLMRVDIRGPFYEELATISSTFDGHIQPNDILNEIPRLQRAGVVRVRGGYVEAIPTLLANHLTRSVLRGRYLAIEKLFVALKRSGRFRLIERLCKVSSVEIAHFWDELFSQTGLFAQFQTALSNVQLLYAVAGAASDHVARLLENGLGSLSREERTSISWDARRYLMSIFHDLLFRKSTGKSALRCILLLAESEIDTPKTSSLEVFYDCFHPFQPQCPLPLEDRLDILRKALSPESSSQMCKIGLQAIVHGLPGGMSFMLREGNGLEPLSVPPEMTWTDIWNYWDILFDMIIAIARSDQSEVAELAQEDLPNILTRYTLFGHITKGLEHFHQVAQWSVTSQLPVSVSRLSEALTHVQKAINHRTAESAETEEILQNAKHVISNILKLLEAGDFSMRLMRWASVWASDEQGEHMKELRALIMEVMDQPPLLTEELLMWLLSDEAKLGLPFFQILGEQDTNHSWLARIEELGYSIKGAGAFSWYFSGLGKRDRSFVSDRLDELTRGGRVTGKAIISATTHFSGDSSSVKRVVKLLEEGRVDRVDVEYSLLRSSPWLNTLSIDDYIRLLKVTAEDDLKYAKSVVNSLIVWLYKHTDIDRTLAEFAWQCLEQVSPNSLEDAYNCDNLASKLVEVDVETSFALLEKRLHQLSLATLWNPLSLYAGQMFWPALCKADRRRALWMPLSLAAGDTSLRVLITGSLIECINQELDTVTLVEFASECTEHACVVCECIAVSKSGFWPLALEIFRRYSLDENVKRRLQYAIVRTNTPQSVMIGLPGIALQARMNDLQRRLSELSLSPNERMWLEGIASILQSEKEAFERFESDIDANREPNIEDDPSASERLWMLERLLLNGKLDTLKGSISKEELQLLLPKLQVSETDRIKLEERIRQWE